MKTERSVAVVQEWSPARIYLVASGVFLLIIGAAGLALNQSFPTSPGAVDSAGSSWLFGLGIHPDGLPGVEDLDEEVDEGRNALDDHPGRHRLVTVGDRGNGGHGRRTKMMPSLRQ